MTACRAGSREPSKPREKSIVVNGNEIPITTEKDPAALPWKKLGCQIALESTGRFTDRASLQKHLDAGAERVILSAPAKDDLDATIVLGVNDRILSASSPHHLQRLLHHQLSGAHGQGPSRGVRDRKRLDDHRFTLTRTTSESPTRSTKTPIGHVPPP